MQLPPGLRPNTKCEPSVAGRIWRGGATEGVRDDFLKKSRRERYAVRDDVVEAGGIEPPSESSLTGTSPGAVCYLPSRNPPGTNTLRELVAS